MALITVPLAANDLDWSHWGLPVTNAINDHEDRISSFETGTAGRVIARHARTTTPTFASMTEAGICWLGFTAVADHLYRIEVPAFGVYGGSAGFVISGRLRYTTDNSTPNPTSSSVVPGSPWTEYVANNNGYVPSRSLCGFLTAPAAGTIKVMWTQVLLVVVGGSCGVWLGSADVAANLVVTDLGTDPGSTGTNV